jgi:hypothetical protein
MKNWQIVTITLECVGSLQVPDSLTLLFFFEFLAVVLKSF